MQGPIQSVEISYFVHATEDADKIGAAIAEQLGFPGKPELEEMEGHFGNKILRASRHLTGEEAGKAFAAVASRMGPGLKRELRAELGKHLDEHSAFYLRLDKQGLVEGRLALTDSDPVRIRVKPRMHQLKGGTASFFARLLT